MLSPALSAYLDFVTDQDLSNNSLSGEKHVMTTSLT